MNDRVPKRQRKRLAKSELWMFLAMKTLAWEEELTGKAAGTRPVAEWGDDDPFVMLCRTYDLTPTDLARLLHDMGDALERRAERSGFDEHWEPA